MIYRKNVEAVLETCFAGFKNELIEAAVDRICDLKAKPLYMVREDGSIEPIMPKIPEEIAEDFCNNYCKWPLQWDEEKEGCELPDSEHCKKCPLNKI